MELNDGGFVVVYLFECCCQGLEFVFECLDCVGGYFVEGFECYWCVEFGVECFVDYVYGAGVQVVAYVELGCFCEVGFGVQYVNGVVAV